MFIKQLQRRRKFAPGLFRTPSSVIGDAPIARNNDLPVFAHGIRELLVGDRVQGVAEDNVKYNGAGPVRCQSFEELGKYGAAPRFRIFLVQLLVRRIIQINHCDLVWIHRWAPGKGQIVAGGLNIVSQRGRQQYDSQPRGKNHAAEEAGGLGPRAAAHRGEPGTQCFSFIRQGGAKFSPAARD